MDMKGLARASVAAATLAAAGCAPVVGGVVKSTVTSSAADAASDPDQAANDFKRASDNVATRVEQTGVAVCEQIADTWIGRRTCGNSAPTSVPQ